MLNVLIAFLNRLELTGKLPAFETCITYKEVTKHALTDDNNIAVVEKLLEYN